MTRKLYQSCWSSDVALSDNQYAQLETLGDVTLAPRLRSILLHHLNNYRVNADMESAGVRPGKVKPVLEHLGKCLSDANAAISSIHRGHPPEGRAALNEIRKASTTWAAMIKKQVGVAAAAERYVNYVGPFDKKFFDEMQHNLGRLIVVVSVAAKELPKDFGASANPHIGTLLLGAHSVFCEAGGRGKYTSKALSFLECVCGCAGYRVQSREALKQVLKNVFRTAKIGEDNSDPV